MSEIIPYEITLGEKPYWVVDSLSTREKYLKDCPDVHPSELGIVALGLFRENSYVDYAAIGRVIDADEEIAWTRAHEAYEWVDWMAGFVYRQRERAAQLRNTERKLGRFLIKYGFAPDVVVETKPSEVEMESYIKFVTGKDEIEGQLFIPYE